jgi:hypothetical protein
MIMKWVRQVTKNVPFVWIYRFSWPERKWRKVKINLS